MEYTEQQEEAFKVEFAAKRKRQLAVTLPLIAVAFVLLVLSGRNGSLAGIPPSWMGPMGFGIILGAVFFSFWNWRCPACNVYLGRGTSPRFCPKCGATLQ